MTKIHFIGDVHAKIEHFENIISNIPSENYVFQVGDFGYGFSENIKDYLDNINIIRGNHDSPSIAQNHKNYLGDYGIKKIGDYKILYVGGAESIDKNLRIEGVSWWRDEQLNYRQLENVIELAKNEQPNIIVSHDVPFGIGQRLFENHFQLRITRTSQALQILQNVCKPTIWVFGHYHMSIDRIFYNVGTRFICLDELEVKTIILGEN